MGYVSLFHLARPRLQSGHQVKPTPRSDLTSEGDEAILFEFRFWWSNQDPHHFGRSCLGSPRSPTISHRRCRTTTRKYLYVGKSCSGARKSGKLQGMARESTEGITFLTSTLLASQAVNLGTRPSIARFWAPDHSHFRCFTKLGSRMI